jgi:hypothetical protein
VDKNATRIARSILKLVPRCTVGVSVDEFCRPSVGRPNIGINAKGRERFQNVPLNGGRLGRRTKELSARSPIDARSPATRASASASEASSPTSAARIGKSRRSVAAGASE